MTETTTQLTVKKDTKGNYILNKRSIHTNTYVFFMFFMKMIKLKNLVNNLLIKISMFSISLCFKVSSSYKPYN